MSQERALPVKPGEWTCRWCGHVNPPEYFRCHGCEADREDIEDNAAEARDDG